jgi:arsenite-transporting ATPase
MSDLDVEPVDDADEAHREETGNGEPDDARSPEPEASEDARFVDIETRPVASDAPEYVLYGGKGGVGKTTMAAATGLASAAERAATLVVSTDPAHSLSDAYEIQIGPRPERLREDVPLYGAEIDPDEAVEEAAIFSDDGPDLGGLGELMGDEAEGLLGGGMPGADEAAAVQQLLLLLDDDRFDRVVVDTAPTGHTLRLLELPELMDTMVGRVLTIRERLSGMLDGITGMFGEDERPEDDRQDLRQVRKRIERLRSTLQNPAKTDFRVVMVPEEMSVTESKRLIDRLAGFDIPVSTVVVNKVMEDLVDVAGDDVPAEEFVSPNLESCAFCQRRWQVQQSALGEAHEIFRGHDVKRVPLFADEVRGERKLRIVAACLS